MRKILFFISVILLYSSCSSNIEERIVSKYNNYEGEGDCIVDLATLMPFEWDSLRFYTMGWKREEIEKDAGVELYKYGEFSSLYLFFKNGELIYIDEIVFDPWEINNISMVIEFIENNTFTLYSHDAKIIVYKEDCIYRIRRYKNN